MAAMNLTHLWIFILYFVLPTSGRVLRVHKRDWIDSPPAAVAEGDVECFSEYMELWIHRMKIEGLRLWLSTILRIQVTLMSLGSLNHQLSACGFSLHKDPDRNYIFRVMYSGCFVQLEHGHYVIVLNLMKRISRFGGRMQNYVMKCPEMAAPPNREHIQCDPDFIQVTRQIPLDSWNNELTWSLALRGSLVVALEDASLIQVNVDIQKPYITVQGRRNAVLSPVQVLQAEGQFLPLKLVSGHYAYSMEATCPNVIQYSSEDTVLHIYKRRMGLTKRGGYDNETLTVSSVSVNQTDMFTWSDTRSFVQLIVPTTLIQKTKNCTDKEDANLQQSFFRIDIVLTFKETNNKMLWTMENTSPCSGSDVPSVEINSHSSGILNPAKTENTASNLTSPYSDATTGPLLSTEASSMDLQTSFQAREEGFSSTLKSSKAFPATKVPRVSSVSPQSSRSPETNTIEVQNSTNSLLAHPGKLMKQITTSTPYQNTDVVESFVPIESTYVTNEANTDATSTLRLASSSSPSERSVDLAHAGEATSDGPSNSTAGNRTSTSTQEY
ncbi:uncharacterized protein C1orf127 homolog [Pygocentrus nattereri]|uniref:uncharacterized protein C1orf127 homolog n=1 Tax=Pygocentrus nattereri TaxID=42514 RepID=UPI0018914DD1|nr:uncharacterized protein C1orf127 homolog [Pygocentrus nattereri]